MCRRSDLNVHKVKLPGINHKVRMRVANWIRSSSGNHCGSQTLINTFSSELGALIKALEMVPGSHNHVFIGLTCIRQSPNI